MSGKQCYCTECHSRVATGRVRVLHERNMVSAVRMLSAEQQGRVEVAADLLGGELCQPSGFTGLSGTDQGRTWDDRSDQQGHDLMGGPPCAPNEAA